MSSGAQFAGCTVDDIANEIGVRCGAANVATYTANSGQLLTSITQFYKDAFEQKRAEVDDLVRQKADTDTSRGGTVGSALDTNIKDLRSRSAALDAEAEAMRAQIERDSAEFEEIAGTGVLRGTAAATGLYTLQDWVVILAFITYAAAAIAVFAYTGYTSGWSRRALGMSAGGILIVTVVLYSAFVAYA
jgi:hypothetical protein